MRPATLLACCAMFLAGGQLAHAGDLKDQAHALRDARDAIEAAEPAQPRLYATQRA